jgi:hypothetical protein
LAPKKHNRTTSKLDQEEGKKIQIWQIKVLPNVQKQVKKTLDIAAKPRVLH